MKKQNGKYSKQIKKRVFELLAFDALTIQEVCKAVGITRQTFYRWKSEKSDFCDTIKKALAIRSDMFADAARSSLLKLIQGYYVTETRVTTVPSSELDEYGKPIPIIKEQVTTKRYIQPNVTAVIFTLCNCDPEHWKQHPAEVVVERKVPELVLKVPDVETAQQLQKLAGRKGKIVVDD